MRTDASFQQILEEKLKAHRPSESPAQPANPTYQDPAHLAFLLGNLAVSYWQPLPQRIYPTQPRPAPRAHVLTQEQQIACDFFNLNHFGLGELLTPAFTRRDLKKAFRAMALKCHPDMNKGAPGPFIALKNHYATLTVLFN